MRRTYQFTSPERQKIEKKALDQMKEVREKIDPALLKRVRQIIQPEGQVPQNPDWIDAMQTKERVDHRKMLEVAVKFLELQPDNKALRDEIAQFLD